MNKLIARIKIIFFSLGAITAIFATVMTLAESEESIEFNLFALLLMILISFLPLYYLLRTGLWDLKNREFSRDKIAITGLIFYFLGSIYFIYTPYALGAESFIGTTVFFGLVFIAIGIRDLKKFITDKKANNSKDISPETNSVLPTPASTPIPKTSVEQFRIKANGFNEIRKSYLIRIIPVFLLSAIAGLVISHFNTDPSEINVYPFVIPFILIIIAFGLFQSTKRQKVLLDSYVLSFDNDVIIREQANTPTINIPYNEIAEITKNANGSFLIKGVSAVDFIAIPAQIDHNEKLEKLISSIKAISLKPDPHFLQKYQILLTVLTVGLMAAVYISQDKILVGSSGIILLILMGYSLIQVQKSKNIDTKTKNGMWIILIPLASIIVVMYYKLSGQL